MIYKNGQKETQFKAMHVQQQIVRDTMFKLVEELETKPDLITRGVRFVSTMSTRIKQNR